MKRPLAKNETICAIATPHGEGGIGVIRVSGKEACVFVAPLYRGKKSWASFESHRAYWGEVVDPSDGTLIDEALFLPMRAPHSYTGEDVVEIQSHGNPFVLEKILSRLLLQGARLAEPGEFTRRAFLNGRMDLSQAEAVMEIIAAKSDNQHQWALSQLKGRLSQKVFSLKERVVSILAQIEAAIDFSGENLPLKSSKEMRDEVNAILDSIQAMLAGYAMGRQIREGFTVVIAGRPNVGKSSLMNYFLQEDRAIVTAVPGTTRDLLQEPVDLEGLSVKLVDTAGYRLTDHPVEQEGIRRAEAAQQSADLTLWLLDASQALTEEDLCLAEKLRDCPVMVLLNKVDLPVVLDLEVLYCIYPKNGLFNVSVKTGEGMLRLRQEMRKRLLVYPEKEPPLVGLLRHRNALVLAEAALVSAVVALEEGLSWEFPAIDLREALDALGQITGETTVDDVLDQVFGRFCIGK